MVLLTVERCDKLRSITATGLRLRSLRVRAARMLAAATVRAGRPDAVRVETTACPLLKGGAAVLPITEDRMV